MCCAFVYLHRKYRNLNCEEYKMKEYDVVAIGELNVDIILNQIEGFPQVGKEIFAHKLSTVIGSSTAIFASNASTLGLKVAVVGMIADDAYGNLIRRSLSDRGVDVSFIIEHPTVPTGATLVMTYGDDRANITYQGTMDVMSLKDINQAIFKKARHIHISSVFMQTALKEDLLRILELAKLNDATTSLDPQWDPREKWDLNYKDILPFVSVFLPNESEHACIAGKTKMEDAISTLKPYVNICVVKNGTHGSTLYGRDIEEYKAKPYSHKKLVDAIGAGDSFNAGFIHHYLQGKSLQECQDFGNLMGAINTTSTGGTSAFESIQKVKDMAKEISTADLSWL